MPCGRLNIKYNPDIHHRQSIRLKNYDYSLPNAYFVTICTKDRQCLFGEIQNRKMILNEAGKIIERQWKELKNRFPNIQLDTHVVMPNHIHGIIVILDDFFGENKNIIENDNVGAGLVPALSEAGTVDLSLSPDRAPTRGAPTPNEINKLGNHKTLGDIIGAFKSITTVEYIRGIKNGKFPPINKSIWQRNFYEHIIRNEKSLQKLRSYIEFNPLNWEKDSLFEEKVLF